GLLHRGDEELAVLVEVADPPVARGVRSGGRAARADGGVVALRLPRERGRGEQDDGERGPHGAPRNATTPGKQSGWRKSTFSSASLCAVPLASSAAKAS